jgi:hypothetical protein
MIGHSFPTLEEKPYISTMNKNRLIPTVGIILLTPFWLWAQGPPPSAGRANAPDAGVPAATPGVAPAAAAPSTPPPPTEAELTLDEAAKKVAALEAVSAELVQKVKMLKQAFEIKGAYRKAPGGRLRLQLKVIGLPGASGEMLQVSDGVTLWDYQQLLESKYYRKIALGPILEKLKAPELDAAAREQVLTRLGIAGPEVLLVGLRKAVHFDQKEEGTYQGHPVWILRGTWQDRQGLLGPNQLPLPESAPLPAYVPSQVTLLVGKDDGWPYQVRLAGRQPTVLLDTRRVGPDGRPIGTLGSIQKIDPSEIELTYTLVTLDPPFKSEDFMYRPPSGVPVEDVTEGVLGELDQMIQMKIAQKKAETARTEPLLDQAIDIPKAGPAPERASAPPPLSPRPR